MRPLFCLLLAFLLSLGAPHPAPAAGSFNGSSSFLEKSTTVITGYPFTVSCMANVADTTNTHTLVSIAYSAGDLDYWRLVANGATAGDPVTIEARRSTLAAAVTSTGYTANTWFHASAICLSATSRTAYLNAAGAGSNSTNITPANIDRIGIGVLDRSTRANYANGLIAEVAIWNTNLTTAELTTLSQGYSPTLVRRGNLVVYLPLVGDSRDFVGGTSWTNTSVTWGTHCRRYGRLELPRPLPHPSQFSPALALWLFPFSR